MPLPLAAMRWSLDPVGGPIFVALCGAALIALLWIGPARDRTTPRRRRTLALLRLAATVLAILAMLRPTLVYTETVKTPGLIVVLGDASRSMQVEDSLGGQSRWSALKMALLDAAPTIAELRERVGVKLFSFAEGLTPFEFQGTTLALPETPEGRQTALGAALQTVLERETDQRLVAIVVLSDGAQRAYPPLDAPPPQAPAQMLAGRGSLLYVVAFGQDKGLGQVRDAALENLTVNQPLFVKNVLELNAEARTTGLANQPLVVQLLVESVPGSGEMQVVASQSLLVREADDRIPVRFEHTPTSPGEYKVALRAQPQPGELVTANNEVGTFVTVLKGGLNVLYVEGVDRPEQNFIRRALDASPDIQVDFLGMRADKREETRPADLPKRFERGKYDVYLIGDMDSSVFDPAEFDALAATVEAGAGLMMIGGASSFGAGGYADTPLEPVLPVEIERLERQPVGEPVRPDLHHIARLKMLPTEDGLQHSMLRLSADPGENQKLWEALPPLKDANKLRKKPASQVFAAGPANEPLLVAADYVRGRVLAFAGDSTWLWTMHGHAAEHKRFWRQTILWLARKDKNSDNSVWIRLEQRRYAPGGRVEFTAGADSPEGQPLTGATFEAEVRQPGGGITRVDLRRQNDEAAGEYRPPQTAGDYTVVVRAKKDGQLLGESEARFIVYEQDLELDNPAADHGLLESLAAATGGRRVAPEQFGDLLEEIQEQAKALDVEKETVRTLYDNLIYLLFFASLLVVEWYLRKKWGLA